MNRGLLTPRLVRSLAVLIVLILVTACSSGAASSGSRVAARLIVGAEDAAQYATIWERRADNAAVASQLRILSDAKAAGLTLVRPTAGSAADTVLATLATSGSDVVTIVGHNSGGTLRFADGSTLPIANLPQDGPRIAVISCSSLAETKGNNIGIPVDIAFGVALQTETLFVERVRNLSVEDASNVAVLQSELLEAFNQAKSQAKGRVIFGTTISVTGGVGIIIYGLKTQN